MNIRIVLYNMYLFKKNCKDTLSMNTKGFLNARYFLLFTILFLNYGLLCQLKLDFETPFPGSVKWEGNVSHFKISPEGQLQLNALSAGESSIFTKYKIPPDSIQIDLYFKLQFAPSNDNFSKIYLFIDKATETAANGYFLRVGENGNNDAIQLWKLVNGNSTLLGAGRMGAVSGDPADARIRIKIFRNGRWMMDSNYEGNNIFEEDLEIFDPAFALPDSIFFGIYCKYTASRADKFFYDDIQIKTIEKDITAPELSKVDVINENTVMLTFSEPLDEVSALQRTNYSVSNSLNNPDQIIYTRSVPHQVTLKFDSKKVVSGILYTLNVQGVKDRSNNTKVLTSTFFYAVKPGPGDIVITELLADPYTGGEDFVEIFNKSAKFLKLDSLILRNAQKNESRTLRTEFVLFPSKYIAISANIQFLRSTYSPPDSAVLITATLPSLNVESGNISILTQLGNGSLITLDSFDYNEKMHFSLIDDTKGVSLERISITSMTNDPNNWHSASTLSKYATPGYKNSNFTEGTTASIDGIGIAPDKKVFTPNGDGTDDFILLNYKTDKAGYLATIRVFDAEGFPVGDLANNYLLGTDGSIKWDGIDSEGRIVRLGMYILHTKIFHPDGDVKMFKSVVVAADNF